MNQTVIEKVKKTPKSSGELRRIEIPLLIRISKDVLKKDSKEPFNFRRERAFKMIVSPEVIDLQDDLIQIEAIYKVLETLIKDRRGTIIDAHSNFPCGYATKWEPITYETYKAALVEGFIFDTGYSNDDEVWDAMQTGDYSANSIGGKIVAGVKKCNDDVCYNYITELELYELSMVPEGANQFADLLKNRKLKKEHPIFRTFTILEKLLDELTKQDKNFLQVTDMTKEETDTEKGKPDHPKEHPSNEDENPEEMEEKSKMEEDEESEEEEGEQNKVIGLFHLTC